MGDVIKFLPNRDVEYNGLVCSCGSSWFDACVIFNRNGEVTGYARAKCHSCGKAI